MASTVFTISPASGKAGATTSINVSAGANTAKERRSGVLTLTGNGKTVTVPVVQYGTPVIEKVSDTEVAAAGGTFTFHVWSDYMYRLTVTGAGATQSWVTGTQTSTGNDWAKHSVELSANEGTAERSVQISMEYRDLSGTYVSCGSITVTQKSGSITVDSSALTGGSLILECTADEKTVSVTSNVDFTASIE